MKLCGNYLWLYAYTLIEFMAENDSVGIQYIQITKILHAVGPD